MSYVLMFFGLLFAPFLLVIFLYTLIFKHLMASARLHLPWRQAIWVAVVDVLEWFRVIQRPASDVLKTDLPFMRLSNEKARAKPKSAAPASPRPPSQNPLESQKTTMIPAPVHGAKKG